MLYLVGLARSGELGSFNVPGLDLRETSAAYTVTLDLGETPLDAVVVDVPASMFVGEDAERRLHDVVWLRPRAERHERIVVTARAAATIMPVGFGSVFSG
ncbi:MAG: GvpL/GvpF family gas vesicle protein, partial [Planctomycetota bacterium]